MLCNVTRPKNAYCVYILAKAKCCRANCRISLWQEMLENSAYEHCFFCYKVRYLSARHAVVAKSMNHLTALDVQEASVQCTECLQLYCTLPAVIWPAFSASVIILYPILSFTELQGSMISSLAAIFATEPSVIRFR